MKKINVFFSTLAFTLAIGAAIITKAAPLGTSFIVSGGNCVASDKPDQCNTTSTPICTVLGVTHYQTQNTPTECLNTFRMP